MDSYSRALPRPISDPVRDGENPSGRDRYEPAAEDGPEDVPSRALSDRERQKEWNELGHIWLLNFASGARTIVIQYYNGPEVIRSNVIRVSGE